MDHISPQCALHNIGIFLLWFGLALLFNSDGAAVGDTIEEGRAYAEAQRADVRSQKFGQGLHSWLGSLSLVAM